MEMVAKKSRKGTDESGNELLENPEALAEQFSKTEAYINKNKKILIGVGSVIALIVAAFFGYKYYMNQQNFKAQAEMFQSIYYFEQDSLNLALNGDGQYLGLVDIADEYNGTAAANLANYYAGAAFLKQGKYELATLYLKDFSSDDLLVQARAYSLIGDAYMELENYDEAVEWYNRASTYKPNEFFTPQYLMKEAIAYEMMESTDKAIDTYDEIIENYPESEEYAKAVKYKARLTR